MNVTETNYIKQEKNINANADATYCSLLIVLFTRSLWKWNSHDVRDFRLQFFVSRYKSTLAASQSRWQFLRYHSLLTKQH